MVNKFKRPIVAGYLRVSTNTQTKWMSIEVQKNDLIRFCKSNNYILKEKNIYIDNWFSWYYWPEKRPALERLLYSGINKKEFNKVVVWKIDRLWRKNSIILWVVQSLLENRIEFESINENFDFNNINWKLLLPIFWGLAEFERNNILFRTLNGKRMKSENGYYVWWWKVAKYGYDTYHTWKGHKLKINEEEKEIVNRIFKDVN